MWPETSTKGEEIMERNGWRITAIIFIVLFVALVSLITYGLIINHNNTKKMETCYYEMCSEYPEALVQGNICHCYDYDTLGQLNIAKSYVIR